MGKIIAGPFVLRAPRRGIDSWSPNTVVRWEYVDYWQQQYAQDVVPWSDRGYKAKNWQPVSDSLHDYARGPVWVQAELATGETTAVGYMQAANCRTFYRCTMAAPSQVPAPPKYEQYVTAPPGSLQAVSLEKNSPAVLWQASPQLPKDSSQLAKGFGTLLTEVASSPNPDEAAETAWQFFKPVAQQDVLATAPQSQMTAVPGGS